MPSAGKLCPQRSWKSACLRIAVVPHRSSPLATQSQHVPRHGGLHQAGVRADWWLPKNHLRGSPVLSAHLCRACQHRQSVRSCFRRSPESQLDSTMESSAREARAAATATMERGHPAPYNLLGHTASTCGPLAASSQRGQMPAHSSAEG